MPSLMVWYAVVVGTFINIALSGLTLVGTISTNKGNDLATFTLSTTTADVVAIDHGPYTIFRDEPAPAVTIRVGESVEGWKLEAVQPRHVVMSKGKERYWLDVGDSPGEGPMAITGIEHNGDRIEITRALRDHVADHLPTVVMQAAATRVDNGYQITDIEPGSIYEHAGLKDGDIVQFVNGVELTDPWTAVQALKGVAREDEFEVAFWRGGTLRRVKIVVH